MEDKVKLTPEQHAVAKAYLQHQVLKFITENQHRFTAEIKAKYGFDPEEITAQGPEHDSDPAVRDSLGNSAEVSPDPSDEEVSGFS